MRTRRAVAGAVGLVLAIAALERGLTVAEVVSPRKTRPIAR